MNFVAMEEEIRNAVIQGESNFSSKKYLQADAVLWKELNGRKMLNYRFERQRNLFGHIVNFYCYDLKLVILINKGQEETVLREQRLLSLLKEKQMQILQFDCSRIIDDLPAVLKMISDSILNHRRNKIL